MRKKEALYAQKCVKDTFLRAIGRGRWKPMQKHVKKKTCLLCTFLRRLLLPFSGVSFRHKSIKLKSDKLLRLRVRLMPWKWMDLITKTICASNNNIPKKKSPIMHCPWFTIKINPLYHSLFIFLPGLVSFQSHLFQKSFRRIYPNRTRSKNTCRPFMNGKKLQLKRKALLEFISSKSFCKFKPIALASHKHNKRNYNPFPRR